MEAKLLHNLAGGLRLLAFLPMDNRRFAPSMRQAVCLGALSGAIWVGLDRLASSNAVNFAWSSVAQISWIALTVVSALLLFSPAGRSPDTAALTLTAAGSILPGFLIVILALLHFSNGTAFGPWAGYVVAGLAAAYLYRVMRLVASGPFPVSLAAALVVVGATWWVFSESVVARPQFWHPRDDAAAALNAGALDAEEAMFNQSALIDAAVSRFAPGTSGKTDVYFVGFAGDGAEALFANEVAVARAALTRKLDFGERSIELINSPRADADTPVASGPGLRFALERIGQRMNVDEDVLLLFLTSHGTEEGKLAVRQPGWPLRDLTPAALDAALRAAGIKWRIIIISACYSGSFIAELENEFSLIVTAARADRKSFGCRPSRELTYFGEALFRDALPYSNTLQEALARAALLVATRERAERFTPSEPQISLGAQMRGKLAQLSLSR